MKKYRMVFILCLFFSFFCPLMVCAKEFVSAKEGLDVMFVMDYSGSMKTNDSRDIARGMVKAFVDTVHSADIRVGFVAYNDRILTFTSPLAIQTEEERADLKKLIDQEQYAGNTDIGLGLSYGLELLEEEAVRKRVIGRFQHRTYNGNFQRRSEVGCRKMYRKRNSNLQHSFWGL